MAEGWSQVGARAARAARPCATLAPALTDAFETMTTTEARGWLTQAGYGEVCHGNPLSARPLCRWDECLNPLDVVRVGWAVPLHVHQAVPVLRAVVAPPVARLLLGAPNCQ